jgi:polysaccharide export outer membrane protein
MIRRMLTVAFVMVATHTVGWTQGLLPDGVSVDTDRVDPASTSASVPAKSPQISAYRIGCGDTLQIMVWKEPDASVPAAIVRPDGKIAMPLLKEIAVANLTPAEAEHVIGTGLRKYIQDADVTVVVSNISSRKAYIVGAVHKEGPIPLQYPMSVLQAISEAGGLTDYAKRKKIYVLRTANGTAHRIPFNYEAVIKGEQVDRNIPLEPNDTIVVPY